MKQSKSILQVAKNMVATVGCENAYTSILSSTDTIGMLKTEGGTKCYLKSYIFFAKKRSFPGATRRAAECITTIYIKMGIWFISPRD